MVLVEQDMQSEGESNYKIAQQLFKLDENLDGKTELNDPEINLIIKRHVFATCLSNDTVTIERLNNEITETFKRLRVSLKRKGRGEAVQLGKSGESVQGGGNYWKNFVGLR